MSREERRQYERMMRGMDRGPALPPAARARAERKAARRAARDRADQPHAFGPRFWITGVLVAAALGYIGMSIAWGRPDAMTIGVIVGVVALAAQVGIRLLMRRAAARRQ